MVDFPHLFLLPPSLLPRAHSTFIHYTQSSAPLSTIAMPSSYFRVSPSTTRNLTSKINELILSLLWVANLTVNFLGELGQDMTPFMSTLFSPLPQTGAMAGSLMLTLSSTFVVRPQGMTCNLNTLPANPSAPILGSFYPLSTTLQIGHSSTNRSTKHLYTLALLFRIVQICDHSQLQDLVQLLAYHLSVILVLYPSSKWIALSSSSFPHNLMQSSGWGYQYG